MPPDHSESNYRMVHEALLSKIEIPPENIHRMAGEKEPQLATSEYEDELIADMAKEFGFDAKPAEGIKSRVRDKLTKGT